MSKTEIPTYSSTALVEHIADNVKDTTIRYCFILGAGASRSSGIKTGGELAAIWFERIKQIFAGEHDKWVNDNEIVVSDLASSYGKIYKRRFEINPEEGYHFIQTEIANSKPSYGYSVLARLLTTQHNVVITTNFDPLTEDALFIYTENRPLVCGHESLSKFVTPTTNRPVIIKIHRDQLLAPKSADDELSSLEQGFKDSLDRILQTYKPIVIGYGGNDPSLMDYLKDCNLLNGIFWCKRPGDALSDRITDLLHSKGGKIFEIPGFDELMFQIHAAVFSDERPLNELIKQTAAARAEDWGNQFAQLSGKLTEPESKAALSKIVAGKEGRAYESWWDVQLAVNAASDTEAKAAIFLTGIAQFPQSAELAGNYANFLSDIKKDYDASEKYYLKALELDPYHANTTGNYANFLQKIKKDYDAAEKYYLKALELDPDYASNTGNYAQFLIGRGRSSTAKQYIDKALETARLPYHNLLIVELWLYRFANFYKQYPQAEKELQKLIADGFRSEGWDFSSNIEDAKKKKHPKIDKVIEYSEKISGNKYQI